MLFYQILYTKAMKIIGHRGARGIAPENTIAGIDKAIEHGVDAVEIDIRVTSDGVAVLHHDPYLTDPDGTKVQISQTLYADLLHHKPDLAALDFAVRAVAHRCDIIIELKPGVPTKQTIAIINDRIERGWRFEEFAVASFDPKILAAVKAELPEVQLIVNELWSGVRATYRARRLGTKRINMYEQWLYRAYVRMTRRSGYQLSVFPANKDRWHQRESYVNSARRIKKWQPYLYGAITDRPDFFEK